MNSGKDPQYLQSATEFPAPFPADSSNPSTSEPLVRQLPPWDDATEFMAQEIPIPSILVDGLLHRGSKLVLGGSSKSFKTWCLMDLAYCVATGEFWLGQKTFKGRVLYLNFEIQRPFVQKRLKAVEKAHGGQPLEAGQLVFWNLRGHGFDLLRLASEIEARTSGAQFDLIIIDPIYKGLRGRSENDADQIGQLMDEIERMITDTGAAVVFGAHFSKGNQAAKESIDRISGSGVFARDPDTILTFTKHAEPDAFTVEATLRNFPQLSPFVVKWGYPRFRPAKDLRPEDIKQAPKGGRPLKWADPTIITKLLGAEKLTVTQWQKKARERHGVPNTKFYEFKNQLIASGGLVEPVDGKWNASCVRQSPPTPETPETQLSES